MFDADLSLVPIHQRVLVAASGGADSMALLVWLMQQNREVVVGHVNHALDELRGGACARDEAWLRERCGELGVPLHSETIELERRDGHVNEAVARTGRYAALERIAHDAECALIATAHTASDALEGLMLNIGRGAGVRGQNGFASSRPLGDELTLVRPLWRVGRQQVRDWLLSQNQPWLEDESNQSELFRRNRVRSELMPLLSDIFGRDGDELARSFAFNAQLARDEDAFLERETQRQLEMLTMKQSEGLLALDGEKLRNLDVALMRRVLRQAARLVVPFVREIEGRKIEAVRLAVVNDQKREVWTWRSGMRVEWTGAGAGNRVRFWRV